MNTYCKQYIGEIGLALIQLGNELQKQAQSNQPLNIHSQVKQTMDNLTFYLHNLNADVDKHRRSCIENMVEIESINCAVHHLLHSKTDDVDSGWEVVFTEELRKLEWLCEKLQNKPDVLSNDSIVLYDFYPQAYTPESKNESWTIRKLTTDSLVVYVHNPTVVLYGENLNTIVDTFETYTRK